MTKTDRRVQRTRELLQKALIDLIDERGYDAITIQNIVDRANVARTTFYVHYGSKEDLFMSCHKTIVDEFQFGPLSREELLSPDAPPGMISAFRHLEGARTRLYPIFQGEGALRRLLRDWSAQAIEANLRAAFAEAESSIPLDMLATYLAGAQIGLIHWWL